jgi:hypothetical protein
MPENFDAEKAAAGLHLQTDRLEVVLSTDYSLYFMNAWWNMLVKGMGSIVCKTAEIVDGQELRLTGRELRLC